MVGGGTSRYNQRWGREGPRTGVPTGTVSGPDGFPHPHSSWVWMESGTDKTARSLGCSLLPTTPAAFHFALRQGYGARWGQVRLGHGDASGARDSAEAEMPALRVADLDSNSSTTMNTAGQTPSPAGPGPRLAARAEPQAGTSREAPRLLQGAVRPGEVVQLVRRLPCLAQG